MTVPPRPAPEVRVSDPRGAPAPARAPRPPRPARGPGPRRLLAAAAVLAVGVGALELRTAQRERRAAGVLDLRLSTPGTTYTGAGGSDAPDGLLMRQVGVRNAADRPVELLGAQLLGGALGTVTGSRRLPGGAAATLVLRGVVRCAERPLAFAPPGSVLRVRASTGAGERSLDLPVPPEVLADAQERAEQTCALRPVGEQVQVRQVRGRVEGGQLLLDVAVTGTQAVPVDLVAAVPALPGLRVGVGSGGAVGRSGPPRRLEPPSAQSRRGRPVPAATALRLVVSVADCAVLRRAVGGSVEVQESALLVDLVLAVEGAPRATVRSVADTGGLPRLLSAAC